MAYRNDEHLTFLQELASEDLHDLVLTLTHNKDGNRRPTEYLTQTDGYKAHYPNHQMYWRDIAGELQCFGANTLTTLFRNGKGVVYREILTDVCDKLKVNYTKASSVERIENNLLMKILTDALDAMSQAELKALATAAGLKNTDGITSEVMTGIFQAIFRAGGFKSYQLTVIVANAVMKALFGRGLSFAGGKLLTKTMSILTGPIGWAITAAWTAIDVAGPAYRVTIPAVIHIAVLRQKLMYDDVARDVVL